MLYLKNNSQLKKSFSKNYRKKASQIKKLNREEKINSFCFRIRFVFNLLSSSTREIF